MEFFATAAKGTEPALRDELRELRFRRVRADRGGVHFEGELPEAVRACLWSRIAVRILVRLGSFDAPDEASLYEGVRALDTTRWINADTTLAVRASCRSSKLTHSQFIAQKAKDAIVDRLRDTIGRRPSVDRDDPDVGVAVHLVKDKATVYLDVSGRSLHERGWRSQAGPAPLRETLAAAVVRLSGWDREAPFADPMCGAGTLAIEAACWANRIAPGLGRSRFGVERWAALEPHERAAIRALRDEARAVSLRADKGPDVLASDIDAESIARAEANAAAAGVSVLTARRSIADLPALPAGSSLVTNPPYGERIAVGRTVYDQLGEALRRQRAIRAAILAGTPAIEHAMPGKAMRSWSLYNGPIECRLLVYDLA